MSTDTTDRPSREIRRLSNVVPAAEPLGRPRIIEFDVEGRHVEVNLKK
jgi:hypothetical protein